MPARVKKYCAVSDEQSDSFVGMRFEDGKPRVVFPRGHSIADDDKECRRDVINLLSVLKRFSDKRDGDTAGKGVSSPVDFPLSSYLYLVQDFLRNGYYVERELKFVRADRGKISWKRTIQQERPILSNGSPVYLNFRTMRQRVNDTALITQIHRYCVYLGFQLLGWLYLSPDYLPPKPTIAYNRRLFVSTLQNALNNTFNDSKRELFKCMLNIVQESPDTSNLRNFSVGVDKFEHVWERLVDHVFGIGSEEKQKFYPKAKWHILNSETAADSTTVPLRPDTIMLHGRNVYILDAKYYIFGISQKVQDLPGASDIQKQITYGRYVHETLPELDTQFIHDLVFNSFVLPCRLGGDEFTISTMAVGTADWERYGPNAPDYLYVLAIGMDTKWLITNYAQHSDSVISELADMIESAVRDYRARENVQPAPVFTV